MQRQLRSAAPPTREDSHLRPVDPITAVHGLRFGVPVHTLRLTTCVTRVLSSSKPARFPPSDSSSIRARGFRSVLLRIAYNADYFLASFWCRVAVLLLFGMGALDLVSLPFSSFVGCKQPVVL